MKHIKTYKIYKQFNESDEIKDDISNVEYIEKTIKHILYPLSDIGYNISVTNNSTNWGPFYGSPSEFVIRVVTYTDKQLVITDDIKYEFDTMVDYLKSEGFNSIYVHYVKEPVTSQIMLDYDSFIESLYQWGRPAPLLMDNGLNKVRNLLFVAKK